MPKITLDPDSPAHDTLDAAARALSGKFNKKSGNETAGMLFKDPDGKYRYSVTAPGSEDKFELHIAVPKGYSVAGIVHSHPGIDERGQVFSPNDLDIAHQLKVPSYVNFLKDDSMRRYTPGVSKIQPMDNVGSRMPLHVSMGDPLDPLPPLPNTGLMQTSNMTPTTGLLAGK